MTFDFPGPAVETGGRAEALTSYNLPVGAWTGTAVPTRAFEGKLAQSAWQVDTTSAGAGGMTTLQILAPLRTQLVEGGYRVLFECEAAECGGFDFRYGTDILPEPGMHVDMGDYRYLAAERIGTDGRDVLSLVVSRTADRGFVQVTQIDGATVAKDAGGRPVLSAATDQPAPPNLTLRLPPVATDPAASATADPAGPVVAGDPAAPALPTLNAPVPPPAMAAEPAVTRPTITSDLGAALEGRGAVALDDLVFASGAGDLTEGAYASLADLATWLKADASRDVALVGHTDASGGFDGNMALSRQRAESVRAALVALGVPAAQLQAQGVGPLSPRASNLTPEGRELNRRVEAMLLYENQ